MKSYWIVAAVLSIAWPSSSQAYVDTDQAREGATQAQQTSTSNSPSTNSPSTNVSTPAAQNAGAQNKGSYLLVELSKTLKANKLKPGDKIKAEVTQDVISHGKVIIPVGTELVGHVTEVSAHNAENPESRLGIVFDRILLKHYHDVNLQAVVQAVAAPMPHRSRVDEPSQMLPPSMVVGARQSSPNSLVRPTGPASGTRGSSSSSSTPSAMADSNAVAAMQAPVTVKQSPTTHTETGGAAAQLSASGPTSQPMSVGTPHGVTGLKGLSLTPGSTASTPGPVIVSNVENVKLESGTQILLHVLSVETPQDQHK
jgi:hypothetical protein